MPRTAGCSQRVRVGRLRKGEQFWEAAELVKEFSEDENVGDAYVTLCVHAGTAAADVVCCSRLGKHAQGENHEEALALLAQANRSLRPHLAVLLQLKTRSGYSAQFTPASEQKRAGRAAKALMEAARRAHTS